MLAYSVSDRAIIAFDTNRKELANYLSKALKASNKAILCITGNYCTRYVQCLKFGSLSLRQAGHFNV